LKRREGLKAPVAKALAAPTPAPPFQFSSP
jgi:hypothetical protein